MSKKYQISDLDKLINGLEAVRIELGALNNGRLKDRDLSWYMEQLDEILVILKTNKSVSALFLKLIQLLSKLKGKNN